MDAPLILAATLVSLLGVAHSYLGERYILARLFRRTELPSLFGGQAFTRHTLRFAWHLTTVAWLGLAALLVVLASPEAGGAKHQARIISVTLAVSGTVSLVGSRGRHISWVVFFVAAALVELSLR